MEDSSPDLSLRLRRGSSGSRDSYYIEFAQGIDSDIEIEETTVPPKVNEGPKIEKTTEDETDKSLDNLAPTLPPVPSDLEERFVTPFKWLPFFCVFCTTSKCIKCRKV